MIETTQHAIRRAADAMRTASYASPRMRPSYAAHVAHMIGAAGRALRQALAALPR